MKKRMLSMVLALLLLLSLLPTTALAAAPKGIYSDLVEGEPAGNYVARGTIELSAGSVYGYLVPYEDEEVKNFFFYDPNGASFYTLTGNGVTSEKLGSNVIKITVPPHQGNVVADLSGDVIFFKDTTPNTGDPEVNEGFYFNVENDIPKKSVYREDGAYHVNYEGGEVNLFYYRRGLVVADCSCGAEGVSLSQFAANIVKFTIAAGSGSFNTEFVIKDGPNVPVTVTDTSSGGGGDQGGGDAPAEGLYANVTGGVPGDALPRNLYNGVGYSVEYDDERDLTLFYYTPGTTPTPKYRFNGVYYDANSSDGPVKLTVDGDIVQITAKAGSGTFEIEYYVAAEGGNFPMKFVDTSVAPPYRYDDNGDLVTAPQGLYAAASTQDRVVALKLTTGDNNFYTVPYNASQGTELYYYNPDAAAFDVNSTFAVKEDLGDGLWKITTKPDAGTFVADCRINGNMVSVQFLAAGLYWRAITETQDGVMIADPWHLYQGGAMENAPYVDRRDFAAYFCNGETIELVEVTPSAGLKIDLCLAIDRNGPCFGMYMYAGYDFTAGTLDYVRDGVTYSLDVDCTLKPFFAFYESPEVSGDAYREEFRMYKIMDENADSSFGDYSHKATLYYLPKWSDFDFKTNYRGMDSGWYPFEGVDHAITSVDQLEVDCGKQHYDENGFMVPFAEGQDLEPMTKGEDYTYVATPVEGENGKWLGFKIDFYANETNLFFSIGLPDCYYGGYVNFLSADSEDPLVASLGSSGAFVSNRFLPDHLLTQAAERGIPVQMSQPGFGSLEADGDAAETLAQGSLSLEIGILGGDALADYSDANGESISTAAGEEVTVLGAIDLSFMDAHGVMVTNMNGKVTVRYFCELEVPAGSVVEVYHVEANGEVETYEATYTVSPLFGGVLSFTTTHFSTYSYAVVSERAPAPTPPPAPAPAPEEEKPAENPFTDVSKGSYYYDAVQWAVANEVTLGTTDTTFSPNNPCSRAQILLMMWRAAGSPEVEGVVNPFTDVEEGLYYKAILWAYSRGITTGSTDTVFDPYGTATRGQCMTFLYRYLDGEVESAPANPFTDVKAGSLFEEPVRWAVGHGITQGTTDTTFSPDRPCTRGHIITFLYRSLAEETA